MTKKLTNSHNRKQSLALIALAALGVVFGDIGTSPLYAIREIFFGRAMAGYTAVDVYGIMSIVFWVLTLVITVKYVTFVLRADNDGEGGVFALYGLLQPLKNPAYPVLVTLLLFAAGLLFGDGIITPAISVLSAVEGLSVITSAFNPFIIPITVGILFLLFSIQTKGTAKVGLFFGPVMLVWFIVLALLGVFHISTQPSVLLSVNPWYAYHFVVTHPPHVLLRILGSVMLVITGGEALYADLGHFGIKPIKWSWFTIAYPALVLNYFGQGAYLLSGKALIDGNLFFSLVPQPFLFPVVILATLATVIASQALISGAFSLTMQAVALGMLPYQKYRHTHESHAGQVYLPMINWGLFGGSVLFVLLFQTSARLASAYGLAVSVDMLINTLCIIVVVQRFWGWKTAAAAALFIPVLFMDMTFVLSNSLKFLDGGFIPVVIACFFAFTFHTWRWGKAQIHWTYDRYPVSEIKDLIKTKVTRIPVSQKAVILLTPKFVSSEHDSAPLIKQLFIDWYGALPQHVILLRVNKLRIPYARKGRYEVVKLYTHKKYGTITSISVNFGFMEDHDIEKVLRGIAKHKEVPLSDNHNDWLVHVVQPVLHLKAGAGMLTSIRFIVFSALHKVADTPMQYFRLGDDEPLSVNYLPVYIS